MNCEKRPISSSPASKDSMNTSNADLRDVTRHAFVNPGGAARRGAARRGAPQDP
jgi:hypothetical protein